METKEYKTIDRAELGWPSGPWDNEPDKVQWPDPTTGLPCLAVRGRMWGNWCGYVGVPEGHPAYKVDSANVDLYAHGGVNFSDGCDPDEDEGRGICHIPAPGESDAVWWFGFDCAHARDLAPAHFKDDEASVLMRCAFGGTYKTLDYVKRQCGDLAAQLAEMK